jgi:hypothetical protein
VIGPDGVVVGVLVAVAVAVPVLVAVAVAVQVAVGVLVAVAVQVGVDVLVAVAVGVWVGVSVGAALLAVRSSRGLVEDQDAVWSVQWSPTLKLTVSPGMQPSVPEGSPLTSKFEYQDSPL